MYITDINCDMGEGIDNDALLMPFISSTNIACGYHAGDELIMKQTIELALLNKVSIGAHPGFADKAGHSRIHGHKTKPCKTAWGFIQYVGKRRFSCC